MSYAIYNFPRRLQTLQLIQAVCECGFSAVDGQWTDARGRIVCELETYNTRSPDPRRRCFDHFDGARVPMAAQPLTNKVAQSVFDSAQTDHRVRMQWSEPGCVFCCSPHSLSLSGAKGRRRFTRPSASTSSRPDSPRISKSS